MAIFNKPPRQYYPADLLRNHSLVQGMVFLTFPGQSPVDFISGIAAVAAAAHSTVATQYGLATANNQINVTNLDWTPLAPIPAGSSGYTVAAIAAPAANANQTRAYLQYNGGTTDIRFCFNSDFRDVAVSGRFGLNSYVNSLANGVDSAAPDTKVDGSWHVFSGSSYGPSVNAELFYDGVAGHNTTGAIPTTLIAAPVSMSSAGDINTPILLVVSWNRGLSAAEHLSFARNPWQIFRTAPIAPPRFGKTAAAVVRHVGNLLVRLQAVGRGGL